MILSVHFNLVYEHVCVYVYKLVSNLLSLSRHFMVTFLHVHDCGCQLNRTNVCIYSIPCVDSINRVCKSFAYIHSDDGKTVTYRVFSFIILQWFRVYERHCEHFHISKQFQRHGHIFLTQLRTAIWNHFTSSGSSSSSSSTESQTKQTDREQ